MEISHSKKSSRPKIEVVFDDPLEAAVFGTNHYNSFDPRLFYWTGRVTDLNAGYDKHIGLLVPESRIKKTAKRLLAIELETAPTIYTPDAHLPTGAAQERGYKVAHSLGRTIHDFLTPEPSALDR